MNNTPKQRLMDLGEQALAEAADRMIERLIATPEEELVGIKKKLASLKRSRRFIEWREVAEFADSLEMIRKTI